MLGILRRVFSFVDWERNHPKAPPPGDMLDASFDAQNQRIFELDGLVSAILRSDGALQNGTVSIDSLKPDFLPFFEKRLKETADNLVSDARFMAQAAQTAEKAASEAKNGAIQAQSRAETARNEVLATKSGAIAQISALNAQMAAPQPRAIGAEPRTDWDDASSEAQAWAESSRLWAESMPDTLTDNALKVMDVTGDHWSSRWWANQAANAFGMLTSLYLGVHATPPVTNANGGPIETGSIYYNSATGQPYVWDGSQWTSFTQPQRAALMTLWYAATASQAAFPLTTPDLHGNTFTMNATLPEGIDVHVQGLKKQPGADFSVNPATSTVTLVSPASSGSIVAIDVLMSTTALGPGAVQNWAIKPLTGVDGVKVTFSLVVAASGGPAVTVNRNEELWVSIDGVLQQSTTDYSGDVGGTITFTSAPAIDSKIFIVWQRPLASEGVGEAPLDGKLYGRKSAGWSEAGWNDILGKPGTFPPTLPIAESDVTNLTADLAAKLALTGGTVTGSTAFTGGVTMGSNLAPSAVNLTKHITLYGSGYGFNVQTGLINVVTAGAVCGVFTATGLQGAIGATSPNTGAFTSLSVSGAVSGTGWAALLAPYAPLANPTFTGNPQAPTPLAGDNDTSIATTSFVTSAIVAIPPAGWASITGKPATFPPTLPIAETDVTNLVSDLAGKLALTGGGPVTGTTAFTNGLTMGSNIAISAVNLTKHLSLFSTTYGFNVQGGTMNVVAAGVSLNKFTVTGMQGPVGATTPDTGAFTSLSASGAVSGAGFTALVAPYAPLASPALTGDPTAPTPLAGDNDTSIATTAFVTTALNSAASATSIADAPPSSPKVGQMWFESDTGITYIFYDDGNTQQWVQISGPQSGQQVDYVRKSGDTMTGSLAVTGQIQVSNPGAYSGLFIDYDSTFGGYLGITKVLANRYQHYFDDTAYYFKRYNDAGTGFNSLTLTRSSGDIAVEANLFAVGGVYSTSSGCFIGNNAGGVVVSPGVAGTCYLRPNGAGSATGQFTVDSAGAATVNGTLGVTGAITTTAGQVYTPAAALLIGAGGGGGIYLRPKGVGDNSAQLTFDFNGNLVITGSTGIKSTGTTWANPSDLRMKDISGDYQKGLAELLRVQPKVFTFKDNPDLGEVIGMIAQEVEPVFPECVTSGPGEIAGKTIDDLRSFDASPMIYALINAVHDLSARIEALEAARGV